VEVQVKNRLEPREGPEVNMCRVRMFHLVRKVPTRCESRKYGFVVAAGGSYPVPLRVGRLWFTWYKVLEFKRKCNLSTVRSRICMDLT
jgi:hypothetical protein